MPIVLNGATSGNVTIDANAISGTSVITLPVGTGTFPLMTLSTTVATTSGAAIDFTSIPSWVKKITVMFNGVSTTGTSSIIVQIGSGSVDTTGYFSYGSRLAAAALATTFITSGITCVNLAANTDTVHGSVILTTLGSNIWTSTGSMYISSSNANSTGGGKTLAGTLDRVRLTTVGGTDTFDAGSVNILMEGY